MSYNFLFIFWFVCLDKKLFNNDSASTNETPTESDENENFYVIQSIFSFN